MAKKNPIILISQNDVLVSFDHKDIKENKLIECFIDPAIQVLIKRSVLNIKEFCLKGNHFYKLELIVHAQKRIKE